MASSAPRSGGRAVAAIPETTFVMLWSTSPSRPQREPSGDVT